MAKLSLMFENKLVKEVPIGSRPVSIGRSPDNDIPIDNLAISNYHARVYYEAGRLVVEDLDSSEWHVCKRPAGRACHAS